MPWDTKEIREVKKIAAQSTYIAPRNEKGQIMKGYSGNPGGVTKRALEVKEYAKQKSMKAMEMVNGIMLDEEQKPADRLAAARVILQAAGVMVQETRVVNAQENDPMKEISSDELKKFLAIEQPKS